MRKGQVGYYLLVVMVTLFALSVALFRATQEAKQFNRFSKTQITWWDALWADYRIIPN